MAGALERLCLLEPPNWILLAVQLPGSTDLFSIVVMTSFSLSDNRRTISAEGLTLFACARNIHLGRLQKIVVTPSLMAARAKGSSQGPKCCEPNRIGLGKQQEINKNVYYY